MDSYQFASVIPNWKNETDGVGIQMVICEYTIICVNSDGVLECVIRM